MHYMPVTSITLPLQAASYGRNHYMHYMAHYMLLKMLMAAGAGQLWHLRLDSDRRTGRLGRRSPARPSVLLRMNSSVPSLPARDGHLIRSPMTRMGPGLSRCLRAWRPWPVPVARQEAATGRPASGILTTRTGFGKTV